MRTCSWTLLSLGVLLVGRVLGTPTSASETDPQSGTWRLDPERSTYSSRTRDAQIKELIVEVEADDVHYKLNTHGVDFGGRPIHESYDLKFGDKDHPATGMAAVDSSSVERMNDGTIRVLQTKNGRVVMTRTYSISDDGNTRTSIWEGEAQPGHISFRNVFVFDRVWAQSPSWSCSYSPNPPYTKEASDAKFQGVVRADAINLPDGRLTNLSILESPGMGLDESVLETLKTWKCTPATHNGKLVPTKIRLVVNFRLEQQNTSVSSEPRGSVSSGSGGVEMLTDTEGVNFNEYLRGVYRSLKKSWFVNMPASVQLGDQGMNTVEFRILQDGSVPQDFVKMVLKSGKNPLDAASLRAVREAGSFGHLPDKFSQPFILLRFTFYYNLPSPKDTEPKR